MQLRGLLFLGLFLGAEASSLRYRAAPHAQANVKIAARQASESGSESPTNPETTSTDDTISSVVDDTSTTSVPDAVSTTTTQPDSTTTSDEADTTVTRTVTVTDADADTITTSTTIQKTSATTIIVTSTVFETKTVTSTGETATETVYETSTQWANQKRAIDLAPRTVNAQGIVIVEAQPTAAPEADVNEESEMLRARNNLAKRATVTKSVTVTVGDSSDKTVTKSVTRTVISTASSVTKTTKTVTETEQEGASTTVTVTSTLVVTSTSLTTGVSTATSDSSSTTDTSSSSGSSGGLSTGAKAGIGAGAGVAALIVLGVALWCCLKNRNKPSKSEIDDMFGSSEVPVGAGRDSTAHLSSTRMSQLSPTIPNVAPMKAPEGYRGTALGDGRAGFAKPKPYGAAYAGAPAVSPETNYSRTATTLSNPPDERMDIPPTAAELGNDGHAAKWHHSNAAEIDGHQVAPRASSPQENVYEMPAQQYR